MGGERTTTNSSSQTKYTATPEEREYLARQNEILKASQQGQINVNNQGLDLVSKLLQGQNLPGYLNQLPGGISPDVVNSISNQAIQDITPQFQSSGILDSGVAAQIAARTSADVRNQAAQFNLQNLSQLLNLAVGGQAQVQQPLLATSGQYGQSLAGLRTVNQSGSQTTIGTNPFLKSFQTSLGSSLGSGTFGNTKGIWS